MHLRGKGMHLTEYRSDGTSRRLANIPDFVPGMTSGVALTPMHPIFIQAGSEVGATCFYDNSAYNKRNPDASVSVRFGVTTDGSEMCDVRLRYNDVH
jgi:hypothetical protein